MALPLPTSLSPSKVASFKDCALAFRFSAIDHLPEAPSAPATKGTLVHRALELLFCHQPAERSLVTALSCLDQARAELSTDTEYTGLELTPEEEADFAADAERLLRNYFQLEDAVDQRALGRIGRGRLGQPVDGGEAERQRALLERRHLRRRQRCGERKAHHIAG